MPASWGRSAWIRSPPLNSTLYRGFSSLLRGTESLYHTRVGMGTPIQTNKSLLVFAKRCYGNIPAFPSFYADYLCFFQAALDKWRLHLTLSMVMTHCRTRGNKTSKHWKRNVEKTCYQITFFTQSYFMLLQNRIWSNFVLKARIMLLKQQQCGNTATL